MPDKCKNPEIDNRRACVAMSRNEVQQQFKQMSSLLKEIKEDGKSIKSLLQEHSLKVVTLEKDVEFIKKEREEDIRTTEKDIHEINRSMQQREKKQMWFAGIMVAISGIIVTIINMFVKTGP